MSHFLASVTLAAVLVLGFLAAPAARADSVLCDPAQESKAKAQLAKAEAAEKSGKFREAYNLVPNEVADCLSGKANVDRALQLRARTARKLGDEATQKGRHEEAFQYYRGGGLKREAERAQMNLAKAKSGDVVTVGNVVAFFNSTKDTLTNPNSNESDRPARLTAIEGYQKELRAVAKSNADRAMADEEKAFAARKSGGGSLKELERAKAWLGLIGQSRQADERAEKRGDTVMTEDARSTLALAIDYYEFAGRAGKVKKVKDKARALGDAYAKKGEKKLAADYYVIAGLDGKAEKLAESHEAEKEKNEAQRQEQFKKDQKALEKELGL